MCRPKVLKLAKDDSRSLNDTGVPCTPSTVKRKRDVFDEDIRRTAKAQRMDSTPTCESPSTPRSIGPSRTSSSDDAGTVL
jgi:hypothetical protein